MTCNACAYGNGDHQYPCHWSAGKLQERQVEALERQARSAQREAGDAHDEIGRIAMLQAQLDRIQLQICDVLDLVRSSTAEQERVQRHHEFFLKSFECFMSGIATGLFVKVDAKEVLRGARELADLAYPPPKEQL